MYMAEEDNYRSDSDVQAVSGASDQASNGGMGELVTVAGILGAAHNEDEIETDISLDSPNLNIRKRCHSLALLSKPESPQVNAKYDCIWQN